ncbi:MAG: PIN domain-containing protein [Rhodospirillaceae bacterium]|nr:PIN domain-containing protein [Rhodospirillaceae bacterium]
MLDTDVVVAALRSNRGAAHAVVEAALRGVFDTLMSVPLALEYEAVVSRPEHYRAAGLSREDAVRFVEILVGIAQPVEIAFRWRPQIVDPDDDFVVDLAVNGGARSVVTFNTADFETPLKRFGISAIKPVEAWRLIGGLG